MAPTRVNRRPRSRSALAAVELAVTLPVILTMLIGLWEVGRIVQVQQIILNAAREGARQAATGQYTNAQVRTISLNYLRFGLNDTTGSITSTANATVANLTRPGTDVSQSTSLDKIQVTVTIPYSKVAWTSLTLVTNSSTVLSNQVTWVMLTDQAYPTTTPQPPQG